MIADVPNRMGIDHRGLLSRISWSRAEGRMPKFLSTVGGCTSMRVRRPTRFLFIRPNALDQYLLTTGTVVAAEGLPPVGEHSTSSRRFSTTRTSMHGWLRVLIREAIRSLRTPSAPIACSLFSIRTNGPKWRTESGTVGCGSSTSSPPTRTISRASRRSTSSQLCNRPSAVPTPAALISSPSLFGSTNGGHSNKRRNACFR
jgi:hypothetical protein